MDIGIRIIMIVAVCFTGCTPQASQTQASETHATSTKVEVPVDDTFNSPCGLDSKSQNCFPAGEIITFSFENGASAIEADSADAINFTVNAVNVSDHEISDIEWLIDSANVSYEGGAFPGTNGACGEGLPNLHSCTLSLTLVPERPGTHEVALNVSGQINGVAFSTAATLQIIVRPSDGPYVSWTFDSGSTSQSVHISVLNNVSLTLKNLLSTKLTDMDLQIDSAHNAFAFTGVRYPGTGGTCAAVLDVAQDCLLQLSFSGNKTGRYEVILSGSGKRLGEAATISATIVLDVIGAGSLDAGFGTNGIVNSIPNTGVNTMRSMALAPDGILLAGYTKAASSNDENPTIVKYNYNGELSDAFGNAGISIQNIKTGTDRLEDILVAANGLIYGAGRYVSGDYSCYALRFTSEGVLDASFATDGSAQVPIGGTNDKCLSGALHDNEKFIVNGYGQPYSPAGNDYFHSFRLGTDGVLDTSYSGDGKAQNPIASSVNGYGLAIKIVDGDGTSEQNDKVLIGGYLSNGTDNDFALLRLNSDGSLDTTFGTGGIAIFDGGNGHDYLNSIALQSDGKIVVAGSSANGTNQDHLVLRLLSNGALDASFGNDGAARFDIAGADELLGVRVQSDGKILFAGYSTYDGDTDCVVARLSGGGAMDLDFSQQGVMRIDFDSDGNDGCRDVEIAPSGKIFVGGYGVKDGDTLSSFFAASLWQ